MKKKFQFKVLECKKCGKPVACYPAHSLEKCPYCGGDFKEKTKLVERELDIEKLVEEVKEKSKSSETADHTIPKDVQPCCWLVACPVLWDYVTILFVPSALVGHPCPVCGQSDPGLQQLATTCDGWF